MENKNPELFIMTLQQLIDSLTEREKDIKECEQYKANRYTQPSDLKSTFCIYSAHPQTRPGVERSDFSREYLQLLEHRLQMDN